MDGLRIHTAQAQEHSHGISNTASTHRSMPHILSYWHGVWFTPVFHSFLCSFSWPVCIPMDTAYHTTTERITNTLTSTILPPLAGTSWVWHCMKGYSVHDIHTYIHTYIGRRPTSRPRYQRKPTSQHVTNKADLPPWQYHLQVAQQGWSSQPFIGIQFQQLFDNHLRLQRDCDVSTHRETSEHKG